MVKNCNKFLVKAYLNIIEKSVQEVSTIMPYKEG
jgi:hypothetical protein